jgi:hypothetical protein
LVSDLSKDGSGPPPAGERHTAVSRYRIPHAGRWEKGRRRSCPDQPR